MPCAILFADCWFWTLQPLSQRQVSADLLRKPTVCFPRNSKWTTLQRSRGKKGQLFHGGMGMPLMIMFLRVSLNASVTAHACSLGSFPYWKFSSCLHLLLFALPVVSQMLDTGLPINRRSWTWCCSCGANGREKGGDQLSWASHALSLYFRWTAGPSVYCFTLWFMERCPLMASITKISSGRSAVENIVSQHRPQV